MEVQNQDASMVEFLVKALFLATDSHFLIASSHGRGMERERERGRERGRGREKERQRQRIRI